MSTTILGWVGLTPAISAVTRVGAGIEPLTPAVLPLSITSVKIAPSRKCELHRVPAGATVRT